VNLSKFFIDRPIFAGVLSVLIFLAGLLAMRVLPISEYPEVVPPSVVVRAQYPGANPKVIAETVATPLEESINGIEGMLYMSSQATTDGLMTPRLSSSCRTASVRPSRGCPKRSAASASPRSRARRT
jgi:multidrug efflux pump